MRLIGLLVLLSLRRTVIWPSIRVQPNDTHGSLTQEFGAGDVPVLLVDGKPLSETVRTTAFRFAKIRVGESIFETAGGLMHSPGGGPYYAGTWCNDELEYAGPWFGFAGDDTDEMDTFEVRPHLPKGWTGMALRNVHAFNQVFDLEVDASGRPKAVPRISQANTKGKP